MSLIQMSISGAALILVTVVIRVVAIDRLPKGTFLALWGIALLRLLLPFPIPSPLSVYSLFGRITSVLGTAGINYISTPTTVDGAAQELSVSLWSIIWGVGVVLFAVVFLVPWLRCRRELQTSLPVENDYIDGWLKRHHLRRNIQIRELTGISTPLTYGILRPVILIPEDMDWENARRLDYILFHEYVHIRRWDGLVKLAATAALCVHWFNPLVWMLYILLNRDIELACDAAVLRRFGESDRADYARMLIGMKENRHQFDPLCSHFSKNATEERITSVMKFHKTSVFTVVLALLLVTTVTATFATISEPVAVPEDSAHLSVEIASIETREIVEQENNQLSKPELPPQAADERSDDVYVVNGDVTFEYIPIVFSAASGR